MGKQQTGLQIIEHFDPIVKQSKLQDNVQGVQINLHPAVRGGPSNRDHKNRLARSKAYQETYRILSLQEGSSGRV